MILYILVGIIVFVMIIFACIRLKYRFWSLQPVFHFYDMYYWFINVGIIRKELPEKNRYVNLKKIKTLEFENVDELTKKRLTTLIRLNYFVNHENKYAPKMENIMPYFTMHNSKAYWSYFAEPEVLIDNKTGKTVDENRIIGVITSRPLHVKINVNNVYKELDVYYVDYLCVDKLWRKKNIAPQLIQTHEYNQSHNNKKISVSLFKREDELTSIVPLTAYSTYCFPLAKFSPPSSVHSKIALLSGDKQNIYYLYNFINEMRRKFDVLIYPSMSNIMELVVTNNVHIKMLMIDGEIGAVYIFKKTCTYIKEGEEIVSCIASINGNQLTRDEFISAFKNAIYDIVQQFKYTHLAIEDISNNTCIISDICIKTHPIVVSPTAYFFYNFAYSPFKSEKCLIIN
jgi:hypothetical protein